MSAGFVFVHNPLVVARTWLPVMNRLAQRGYSAKYAALHDDANSALPWWQQHVKSAIDSLAVNSHSCILVGHSGGGPLLPLIGQALPHPPVAYLFVDAGILWHSASRLEMMVAEDEEWARAFEAHLRAGGKFPEWSDDQLSEEIPDAEIRLDILHSLRPKPLSYFTETIPVPFTWNSAPCAYLQLSGTYQPYADQARRNGWYVEQAMSHHFAIVTDPDTVAASLVRIMSIIDRDFR